MNHRSPFRPGVHHTRLATLAAVWLIGVFTLGWAHVPHFPEGDGPFEVDAPTVSKAYYLNLAPGQAHTYRVPPLERTVPMQVLVLDDALGAQLGHELDVSCDGEAEHASEHLDLELFEPFSQIEHRIRIRGTLGPSTGPCLVTVRHTEGPAGPYTFVIGDEERFSASDLIGLVGLGGRLDAWRERR